MFNFPSPPSRAKIDRVAGRLKYAGPPKTIAQMD